MDKGTLISFLVKGNLRAAVVEGPEGKAQFRVHDSLGNNHLVHPRDILFNSAEYKISGKASLLPTQLAAFLERAQALQATADLASAWELLSTETGPFSLETLAELLFGDCTLEAGWILFQTLSADSTYFRKKAQLWEAKTAAQVEEARKQSAALLGRAKSQDELRARLQARLANPTAELLPDDLRKLESLKKFALWADEAPEKSSAHEILQILGQPKTEVAAFQTLIDLHVWSKHENLDLHRSGIPQDFSPDLLTEAGHLVALPLTADPTRVDLTHHFVFTIDDESTTEVDDGLSVMSEGGQTTYWVHIADPDSFVPADSPLDREARRRATTVYLPTGKITMFPPLLAEGPLSLRQGQTVPALSFGLRLSPSGELVDWQVVSSLIRPTQRLSYDSADHHLAAGDLPDLTTLAEAAERRFRWRGTQGAIQINLPEIDLKVEGPEAQTLEIIPVKDTVSRNLVTEWMVCAGEACARFCQAQNLPVPYRFQPAPDLPSADSLALLPDGPVRNFAILKSMNRSGSALEVQPHSGLGLAAYVQATSPIRRYADLLTHRQVKTWLKSGQPLYTAEELSALLPDIEAAASQSVKLERLADRYWMVEYFRRHKTEVFNGLLLDWLRPDDRLAAVLIQEVGYRVNFKLPKDHAVGAILRLKVSSADPRKDLLQFQEV